ncbi:hypothetical protein DPMN_123570 [Dreissena polymorpha]|uniref:Retrotransposon gag domain-containing protein n=1 Tax=Dreissena polymorpha TaxID=45954 RepID=A0A9D4GRV1_DREPO|nr:hypothetical protein DPMN_123570 [Dreissena polymorpha]
MVTLVMKPDMYDGSSSYEQYASHFEDCSELSGWDNRTKVLMLAASLRGAARNFYMSLTDDERRNYCTLTTRLSERFGNDSKHQCLWLNKLENRRRSKGESIASLADDKRQLCQKAYSDLDHRSQEKTSSESALQTRFYRNEISLYGSQLFNHKRGRLRN